MSSAKYQSTYGQQAVEVKETALSYRGFFTVHQAKLKHKLFRGGWSDWISREVVDRGHAVVVLPYDPVRDSIVMLEQFRVGAVDALGAAKRHPSQPEASPWLLELVAGMVDGDESGEEVAAREMQEEAGLTAERLEFALSYMSSPGGLTERITIYVAQVDATSASAYGGLASEHEDIRVFEIQRTQALELLDKGYLDNAATVIALQWLALHREQLLQKWNQE
ncbi:ADP-ribose diphosphatase [Aliidiomarina taiwanensis]|uniref:ADP-ribose pyrophosphatase n=1 Tax=Aliidiomarina taiwanensis TaxID=946228 RepID=A0A432WZV0_9GAMM|nr:NUDIX domain-containing protein [Aliidiomarina taiwanensis]RUO39325.1 ADP-ribose diphosphatase [Aliidiomarina taiwanensis]